MTCEVCRREHAKLTKVRLIWRDLKVCVKCELSLSVAIDREICLLRSEEWNPAEAEPVQENLL